MKVDNFKHLALYIDELKDKEDFFWIQIIQRKKDGHEKSERVLKNFYIYNKEYFFKRMDEIKEFCEHYNARAYFWINPRNARKITLECIKTYADYLTQNDCSKGYKLWDKKCGACPSSNYDHLWIVDIDSYDVGYIDTVIDLINQCRSKDDVIVKEMIPTVNGFHLITAGFDVHHFRQLCRIHNIDMVDIHKDNPTILYYAENER